MLRECQLWDAFEWERGGFFLVIIIPFTCHFITELSDDLQLRDSSSVHYIPNSTAGFVIGALHSQFSCGIRVRCHTFPIQLRDSSAVPYIPSSTAGFERGPIRSLFNCGIRVRCHTFPIQLRDSSAVLCHTFPIQPRDSCSVPCIPRAAGSVLIIPPARSSSHPKGEGNGSKKRLSHIASGRGLSLEPVWFFITKHIHPLYVHRLWIKQPYMNDF